MKCMFLLVVIRWRKRSTLSEVISHNYLCVVHLRGSDVGPENDLNTTFTTVILSHLPPVKLSKEMRKIAILVVISDVIRAAISVR